MPKLTHSLIGAALLYFPAIANAQVIISYGTVGDDVLEGTQERDGLSGLAGDDVLNGFEGDDELRGDCGDDTFEFGRQIGRDRVFDSSACQTPSGSSRAEYNEVEFTYYRASEVTPRLDGRDLVLDVLGRHEVRFVDFANDPFIDRFFFRDGRRWLLKDVLDRVGLTPRSPAILQGLRLTTSPQPDACAQGFAFAVGKTSYACSTLFLDASLELNAHAPSADAIELEYTACESGGGSRCNDAASHRKVRRSLRSGETFRVPGYFTMYGEEDIHNVDATLTLSRDGKRQTVSIQLRSPQYR